MNYLFNFSALQVLLQFLVEPGVQGIQCLFHIHLVVHEIVKGVAQAAQAISLIGVGGIMPAKGRVSTKKLIAGFSRNSGLSPCSM